MTFIETAEKAAQSVRIIKTILFKRTLGEAAQFRAVSHNHVTTQPLIPMNTYEDILAGFLRIMLERNIPGGKFDYKRPYWLNEPYRPLDIFNATIQFFDDHNEPLPKTSIPPVEDVRHFGQIVLDLPHRINVQGQLNILLNITNNNILAAANLGFMATRFYARGTDRRVYPEIDLTFDDLRRWNNKVAQFEVHDKGQQMHGPSDTYYFWTHFFVALAYKLNDGLYSRVLDFVFDKGTPAMVAVRKYIVRGPTSTPHREPSIIGRGMGLAIAHLIIDKD